MSGTQTNEKRSRPMKTFTLSQEAIERLEKSARKSGMNQSSIVDELLRTADLPSKPRKKEA